MALLVLSACANKDAEHPENGDADAGVDAAPQASGSAVSSAMASASAMPPGSSSAMPATSGSAMAGDKPPAPVASDWTYGGERGAVFWGDLKPEWATCKTGQLQSPVDLPSQPEPGKEIAKLSIDYLPIPLRIVNTGRTIRVNNIGNNYISLDKTRFELLYFEFHSPSEHTLAGKRYELELQLVHKGADGTLAVVAVMFEKGNASDAFKETWKRVPKVASEKEVVVKGKTVDLSGITSLREGYDHYTGSLTSPPCTEGVSWYVLKKVHQVAAKQIDEFRALTGGRSNRLIQPLGERKVFTVKP